jgi:hypothetical protein
MGGKTSHLKDYLIDNLNNLYKKIIKKKLLYNESKLRLFSNKNV